MILRIFIAVAELPLDQPGSNENYGENDQKVFHGTDYTLPRPLHGVAAYIVSPISLAAVTTSR